MQQVKFDYIFLLNSYRVMIIHYASCQDSGTDSSARMERLRARPGWFFCAVGAVGTPL